MAVEPSNKSIPQVVSELWELTKDYARQETVDPLKGVARYVAFGLGGALLGAVGVVMLMLAMLRALQTETNLTGNWSWAPYGLVLLAGVVLIMIAVARINRK